MESRRLFEVNKESRLLIGGIFFFGKQLFFLFFFTSVKLYMLEINQVDSYLFTELVPILGVSVGSAVPQVATGKICFSTLSYPAVYLWMNT